MTLQALALYTFVHYITISRFQAELPWFSWYDHLPGGLASKLVHYAPTRATWSHDKTVRLQEPPDHM